MKPLRNVEPFYTMNHTPQIPERARIMSLMSIISLVIIGGGGFAYYTLQSQHPTSASQTTTPQPKTIGTSTNGPIKATIPAATTTIINGLPVTQITVTH